jgi:hypothetical protein
MNDRKECFEVDENGRIIEVYFYTFEEIEDEISKGKRIIEFGWTDIIYTPKFDFGANKWVEGLTQEEIDTIQQNQPPPGPTLSELKEENRLNALAIMELTELFLGGM